jgi:hypothetical protein
MQDYITFHATEKVNKALESLIHTQEWRELEEYVFLHILAQENLSLTEGQLFQVNLTSILFRMIYFGYRGTAIPGHPYLQSFQNDLFRFRTSPLQRGSSFRPP